MKTKSFHCLMAAILVAGSLHAQPPGQPSAEERLKHVTEKIGKEITLSASQKTAVTAAYKDFFASMEKLREKDGKEQAPPPPPPPRNMEVVKKLSQLRDQKIKAALSAAQYAKYTELEKSLRPPMPGKQGPPPEKNRK
jgi:hypothetical protein